MTQYAMAIDTLTCIGCYACTVACKMENGSPDGIWLAPVVEKEVGVFPQSRRLFLPMLCNHCVDAPCLDSCPTRAITRRDDGIVLVDKDMCCGSRACVLACPYGALHYYASQDPLDTPYDRVKVGVHSPGTVQKCTFCVHRIDAGLQPACVEACPTGARIFGDADDAASDVAIALNASDSAPMGAPLDTQPSVHYLVEGARRAGGSVADIAPGTRQQREWGLNHAIEFWMLGAGAGLFVAGQFIGSWGEVLGFDVGALLAAAIVALGGLVLIADLGRPERFWRAFAAWRSNWISRGAVADAVFIPSALLAALLPARPYGAAATVVAVASALVVAAYPGLAMDAMKAVPGWQRPRNSVSFAIEAGLSGVAITGLVTGWTGSTLALLAGFAVLRAAIPPYGEERRWSDVRRVGSMIVAVLAVAAFPEGIRGVLGGVAGFAALAFGLIAKVEALASGDVQSPFGPEGELVVSTPSVG